MLILSRVSAAFHNRKGETVFTVRPGQLNTFLEAPEEIREDPLFDMLSADGSLEAVKSVQQRKKLENDPLQGVTPEGRKTPQTSAAEGEENPEEPETALAKKPSGKKG